MEKYLMRLKNGAFSCRHYIAQCLVDFGYPLGSKGSQTFEQKYNFQLIRIANITVDLGITFLRPETKLDKIAGRFFNNDIDFDGFEKFNEKYFLASNKKAEVLEYFDAKFLTTITKYNDILLTTNCKQIYISFDKKLNNNQSRITQDILSSFKYLAKN